MSKEKIVWGMNSGYQAINLAYMLGAEVVLLLGYVMSGRGQHWFGRHPAPLDMNTNHEHFVRAFEKMEPGRYGLEVINCSTNTALTCFRKMTLDDAISVYSIPGASGSCDRDRAIAC